MPSPVRWPNGLTQREVVLLANALRERLDPLLTRTLERGLTLADHLAGQVVELRVAVPDDWVPLSLLNGFTAHADASFGVPAVRKCHTGRVYTRGLLARGAGAPAAVMAAFVAPAGYAPAQQDMLFPGTSTGLGEFRLQPSGAFNYQSGGVGYVSLAGLSWDAADRRPARPAAPLATIVLRDGLSPAFVLGLNAVNTAGGEVGPWEVGAELTEVGGRPALKVWGLPGLGPGSTYDVTLFVGEG